MVTAPTADDTLLWVQVRSDDRATVNQVLDDVVKATDPVWAKVVGDFRPRGGISTVVEAFYPRPKDSKGPSKA